MLPRHVQLARAKMVYRAQGRTRYCSIPCNMIGTQMLDSLRRAWTVCVRVYRSDDSFNQPTGGRHVSEKFTFPEKDEFSPVGPNRF